MGSCKDCVHVEVCKMHYRQKCELTYESKREVEIAMRKAQKAVDIECDYYKDRSRFVELPDDFPKGRLTTDNPLGNFDALMNYAYAKDGCFNSIRKQPRKYGFVRLYCASRKMRLRYKCAGSA